MLSFTTVLTLGLAHMDGSGDEQLFDVLTDIETDVASAKKTSVRESPGIVTIITRDEIEASGARDLADVLQLVPGFAFAADVQASVGVAFRGIWGQEGKVLLLFDGEEMNETLYLTPQFGNHYPLETIERIEIIRGPGSARYGGNAELAVINIVSRGASLQGAEAFVQYGQMAHGFARANVGLSYGQRFGAGLLDGLELSVDAFAGEGAASDAVYDDGYGNKTRLGWENAQSSPTWLNISARWHDLHARLLGDCYRTRTQDQFDVLLNEPIADNFQSYVADVGYDFTVVDGLTITPRLTARRQLPWNSGTLTGGFIDDANYFSEIADRYSAEMSARWDALPTLSLSGGLIGALDTASVVRGPNGEYVGLEGPYDNGKPSIAYQDGSAFGELSLVTPVANITAGARYELNSQSGDAFVPRVALTKSVDRVHAKLLVSGAFKPPGIANIKLNPEVKPERTRVIEGEVGYALLDNVLFTANAYDITINGPIVYSYDDVNGVEVYQNFPRTGSRGAELTLRIEDPHATAALSYAFSTTEGKNEVPLYDAGRPDVLRGIPAQTFTATGTLKLSAQLSVTPTLILLSERYGWLGGADDIAERSPPIALAHVSVLYKDVLPGFDARLGVSNLLDTDYRYIQAYDGGHAPVPAHSREVLLSLTYRIPIAP